MEGDINLLATSLLQVEDRVGSGFSSLTKDHHDQLLHMLDEAASLDHKLATTCEVLLCDESQPYLAISHVWGSPTDDLDYTEPPVDNMSLEVSLDVAGKWTNRVGTSAQKNNISKVAFLQTLLQQNGNSQKIWFDWKDIDQKDTSVKHEQVRHLPTVYRNATVVAIVHTCGLLRRALQKAKTLSSPSEVATEFMKAIEKSRYRTRVWTLQEECLARSKCHILVDHCGRPIILSRQNYVSIMQDCEGISSWENDQHFREMLDHLFGHTEMQQFSSDQIKSTFFQSKALSERSCSVAKDLYFAVAIPCGIDLNLTYEQTDREVLLVWAKYLMENNLLTTSWRGYACRYSAASSISDISWVPFVIPPETDPTNGSGVVDSFRSAINLTNDNLTKWNYLGLYSGRLMPNGAVLLEARQVQGRQLSRQKGWEIESCDANYFANIYASWIEFCSSPSPRLGSSNGHSKKDEPTVTYIYSLQGTKLAVTIHEDFGALFQVWCYTKQGQDHLIFSLKPESQTHLTLLATARQPYQSGNYVQGNLVEVELL
ncbi:hypothetical protein BC830DRAFT_166932 [Chytriomyces sp. MP71]|nr:hypothetical protein BC830DRAFT_166932 [Chytriomyces sp. MP71]